MSTGRSTNGNAMQITEGNSVCTRTDDGWLLFSSFHCVKILCIPACSLCALVFAARISTVVIIWQNYAVVFNGFTWST